MMICLTVNLKESREEKEECDFLPVYGLLGLLPKTEGGIELNICRIMHFLCSSSCVMMVWTQPTQQRVSRGAERDPPDWASRMERGMEMKWLGEVQKGVTQKGREMLPVPLQGLNGEFWGSGQWGISGSGKRWWRGFPGGKTACGSKCWGSFSVGWRSGWVLRKNSEIRGVAHKLMFAFAWEKLH